MGGVGGSEENGLLGEPFRLVADDGLREREGREGREEEVSTTRWEGFVLRSIAKEALRGGQMRYRL